MADKKDLAEAQRYSRRRLVTAFTSGIPSDVELTPKKNQTPVIVGIGLTVIAILIGVFYGYMKPALPDNWRNNKLIVAKHSAARYVSANGKLHPVINAISARLMIPSTDFDVITVDDEQLEGIPIDSTLGILGAPDSLPERGTLVSGTATSCTYEHRLYNTLNNNRPDKAVSSEAVVAHVDGTDYLITGMKRYQLPSDVVLRDGFLRAYEIPQTAQIDASIQWLNLFEAGTAMQQITVDGADGKSDGVRPGAIVMQQDAPSEARYLVMNDGSISHLDEVSYALYAIGKSDAQLEPVMLSASEFQRLTNADRSPLPPDWPRETLTMTDSTSAMCAALPLQQNGDDAAARFYTDSTIAHHAPADTAEPQTDEANITTTIHGGAGALVRASIGGNSNSGTVYAIDATGTAYPLPGAQEETLKRLGYTNDDVHNVPRSWVDIFPTGVELTPQAAASAPGAKKPDVETVKERGNTEQAEAQ